MDLGTPLFTPQCLGVGTDWIRDTIDPQESTATAMSMATDPQGGDGRVQLPLPRDGWVILNSMLKAL